MWFGMCVNACVSLDVRVSDKCPRMRRGGALADECITGESEIEKFIIIFFFNLKVFIKE